MVDFISKSNNKSLPQIYKIFKTSSVKSIDAYIDFLEKNELIFWVSAKIGKCFMPLSKDFHSPCVISNAIIEVNGNSNYDFNDLFCDLIDLGCSHIQIKNYSANKFDYLKEKILTLQDSRIKSIEFFSCFTRVIRREDIDEFLISNKRVRLLVLYNSPENRIVNVDSNKRCVLVYTKQSLDEYTKTYRFNSLKYMNVNITFYNEALKYHSFFNQKVTIAPNGDIKNSPNQNVSFGNILKDRLSTVVNRKDFQILWNVKKDETLICKECEFRYMCLDTRIPIKKGGKFWFHDEECNYNPKTKIWKNEN